MILCYHKVFPIAKTHWWLTVDGFHRQLAALQSYDVVSLDAYDPRNPDHVVITFDGIYDNVRTHALPVLARFSYPFELFVIGDWVGRENTFDQLVEPSCNFACIDELDDLVAAGGRVQWHTRSHRRLTGLNATEVEEELIIPERLSARYGSPHLDWFAYPHGDVREEHRSIIRRRFKGALSCDDGDLADRYNLPRTLVFERHDFFRRPVSVRVRLGTAPWLVRDTLDSLERQIVKADHIHIDADEPASPEVRPILDALANAARDDVVAGSEADYDVTLTAGDRMRSDYILRCRVVLDQNPASDEVTTDVVLFGPGSDGLPRWPGDVLIGRSSANGWGVYRRSGIGPQETESRETTSGQTASGVMRRSVRTPGSGVHAALLSSKGVLHISEPLLERFIGAADKAGRPAALTVAHERDLCRREAAAIQAAAMARRRDREIDGLSAAFTAATAEIDRLGSEHTINAAEIIRLNLAYGALEAETRRVNEAYGLLSLELERVRNAYGEQQAVLINLKSGLRDDEASTNVDDASNDLV